MKLALLAGFLCVSATAVAAQAVGPGRQMEIITVSFVTAVFLSGGAFAVTRHKANAAHTRISAHEVKQELEDSKTKLAIDATNRHIAEQHVAVVAMFGQVEKSMAAMELRLVDRINEASHTTPAFDRRRLPRERSDVGADINPED